MFLEGLLGLLSDETGGLFAVFVQEDELPSRCRRKTGSLFSLSHMVAPYVVAVPPMRAPQKVETIGLEVMGHAPVEQPMVA